MYLDEHVFIGRQEVGFIFEMSDAEIDDVGQQLFHALNLIQPLFQQSSDSIVGRQKHRQILTLLEGLAKGG